VNGVDGAFSGDVESGDALMGTSASFAGFARFGHKDQNNGTAFGHMQFSSSRLLTSYATGQAWQVRKNNDANDQCEFDGGNFTVTGNLSAVDGDYSGNVTADGTVESIGGLRAIGTGGNQDELLIQSNTASGQVDFLYDINQSGIYSQAMRIVYLGLLVEIGWNAVFNSNVNMPNLPTSSAGLSAGDVWNDGGTLKIV
jgi:hypothetical protein